MSIKTRIERKVRRKKNQELVETILKLKKNEKWLKIADVISRSRRKKIQVNLEKINSETEHGDTIIVPGKVLGKGDVDKKIRICALGFSETALKKLQKTKSEAVSLVEEIKKNPQAKGVKILI